MNITKPADADRFQHLDSTKTGVDQEGCLLWSSVYLVVRNLFALV